MNVYDAVTALFQSVEDSVAGANALSAAYEGGKYHQSFGENDPNKVATNLAGLYAADTAANQLGAMRGHLTDGKYLEEVVYVAMLAVIRARAVTNPEAYVLCNTANATWRTCQPFREIGTKPLNRICRPINKQFNLLTVEERLLDLDQLSAGAAFIIEKIADTLLSSDR